MTPDYLTRLQQHIAPQRALTRLAGWFGECRWVWLKNILIRYFIRRYDVDVNAALITDLESYPTFNSFFTRLLKPELRPIVTEPDHIASPVDGCVSQMGLIEQDVLFQAKGFHFNLCALLGGEESRAAPFYNGAFATLYLAPRDYHRVHMPITGTLRETVYVPGTLFSVSQKTAAHIPHLFARNERLICLFDTHIGPMAVILVGAMLVGSISTIWETKATATLSNRLYSAHEGITLLRGAELGHFKMGSTVIVLFPPHKVAWASSLESNSFIQMGQFLGKTGSP